MSPDFLAQLAPDHAPLAPGWWPPAPGWWVLAALALALLAMWLHSRRDLTRAPRRAALKELRALRTARLDDRLAARAIEDVLRRYAVTVFGRGRVARLAGADWLAFLGARGAGALEGELGRALLASAFGNAPAAERTRWLAAAESFVRQGRRRARRRIAA
jgi:hypothetical protein